MASSSDGPIVFERHVGGACAPLRRDYLPRRPEQTVLYRVVSQHLDGMLSETAEATEHGFGYPRFIGRSFRSYLRCGQLEHGFARIRCEGCGYERPLPFSCKSRVCPSCHARRMHDTAERLVDHLLPAVPYRQWVFTVPRSIRYLMAQDRLALCAIHRIFIRCLFAYQRRQAKAVGLSSVHPGAVTFVQHFGSALNLNIHFHTLAMDGVFVDDVAERPILFADLPLIEPDDVKQLLIKIARRTLRYAASRTDDDIDDIDDDDTAALRACQRQAALAGATSLQRQDTDHEDRYAPLYCAAIDGFSLHANVTLRAGDPDALRRVIRYCARQAFAQDRLSLTDDGRVAYRLKRPFGPHKKTQLTFELKAFLHRLAALIPAPYLHVTRYSGIFAPNAQRRWELSAAGIRVQKRAIAQGVDGDAKDAALRWADAPLVALGRTSRQNVQYRRAQMPTLVLGGSASARSQARGSKACSDTNPVGARRGAKLNANARNHGYAKAQPTAVKRHTNPVVTNRRAVNRPAVQRPVVRRPVVQRPVFRRPVVTARRPLRPAHGLF